MTTEETPTYTPVGEQLMVDSTFDFSVHNTHIAVVLDDDGSRRIEDIQYIYSDPHHIVILNRLPNKHIVYWGPSSTDVATAVYRARKTGYLPYPPADGILIGPSTEPVNQVPKFLEWMKHISTFAHEIDMLWPEHSIMLREADNYNLIPGSSVRTTLHNLRNQFTLRYGRGICGYAFDRVDLWSKLDPLQELWKTQKAGVLEDVEALCLTCNHAFWLRQFLHKHDPLPWINSVDAAVTHPTSHQQYYRVPMIDKTNPELWVPHATKNITTIAGNAPVRWWKNQMINFGKAVDYFDDHFASRD